MTYSKLHYRSRDTSVYEVLVVMNVQHT